MHRTQILLEEWQYETLRSRAEREGRSLSDLVRELLRVALEDSGSRTSSRLDAMEGIGEDTASYGENHDRYLYGARDED
ncbi:MAG: ribbon-helix-helix protein, CopG family [Gammaproteobacteria bacterium]|jgi:plasmid stability protein|nr:ribbon-helix-helix protein, CopG family [Gammaproteobacteria bacterium]